MMDYYKFSQTEYAIDSHMVQIGSFLPINLKVSKSLVSDKNNFKVGFPY